MSFYVSRDSSLSTVGTDLVNTNPEDLSDADLMHNINLLRATNRYLALENEMLEMFLMQNDPELLEVPEQPQPISLKHHSMSSMLLLSNRSSQSLSVGEGLLESRSAVQQSRSVTAEPSTSSSEVFVYERGPRINMSNKEDITSRLTDDLRAALDKLLVTSSKTRANLKAQLEETQVSLTETQEAQTNLETLTVAVDPITGRIPAERFIRHVIEWLKKSDSMVGKLRLRTGTLRTMLVRVSQLLEQKEELGESLAPIDFEQQQIENRLLLAKIDEKNRNLLEMKKMTGRCNLLLTQQKKKMAEQITELSGLQEELNFKEGQVKSFEEEADHVDVEVRKASEKYDEINDLMEKFTTPDVLEYIKKKKEVNELNKAVKVWMRREKIQQSTVTASKRLLHKLAGSAPM